MITNKIYLHADDYGRSLNINKSIENLIKINKINSISVIVNLNKKNLNKKFNKKINLKLHLNLTDGLEKNIGLFSLFLHNFYESKTKTALKDNIKSQLTDFKKIYNKKTIYLDGHEHVHLIPWIFNFIIKNSHKYNIKKIRVINEKFIINNFKDLLNINFLRNFRSR